MNADTQAHQQNKSYKKKWAALIAEQTIVIYLYKMFLDDLYIMFVNVKHDLNWLKMTPKYTYLPTS